MSARNHFFEWDTFVGNRNSGLPLEGDPSLFQLIAQTAFIKRFQRARSGLAPGLDPEMHLNGQPDDSFGQFARKQHAVVTPRRSVSLRALRVKRLFLRHAEPRGPNGKPPDPTSAGADAIWVRADGGTDQEISLQNQ